MLVPDESVMETWQTISVAYSRNDREKTHASGYTTLGLPRLF